MPPKSTRARTVAAGASPAAPPASTVGRRVTRLRLRELGQETAAAGDVASDKPGLSRKKRKVQGKEGGDKAAAGAGGGGAADPPALLSRVIPPYPRSGDSGDVLRWIKERRRIYQLPDPEDTVIPCTCRTEPNDPQTAIDVESTPDKHMIRRAARSVVGVVSTKPDGKGIALCTGIVVGWNEATKSATIVTSSATVCYRGALIHPKPKLLVHLPTRTVVEGRLLFFNAHYRIALLEVFSDSPLQPANLGSSTEFGEEVFALARDDESSLSVRRGTVLWHEPPECLKYMYCLSLSCEVARGGTGGPVIDQHGDVVGMAFRCLPNPDILPASILQTCIRMWTEFSRIARPDLGIELRAFELLDVSHQEEIELEHSVRDGFIVSVVYDSSTAARLDISQGDMIVSYNGRSDFTLHKFEDFLLSIGWGLLASVGSSWNVDLELEVYNPVRRTTRSITYPLEFSDASERVLLLP